MKKVLAIALLCAVSSFATWDKFPAKEAGKGEAKVGVGYWINPVGDKSSILGATLGGRYSIIEGLEASLQIPFPLSASTIDKTDPDKSKGCEADDKTDFVCPPTYGPPVIGVRYWLPFGLGVALDIALPLQGDAYQTGGTKDKSAKNTKTLDFSPAVQYSTGITSELSVGAEVSLDIHGQNSESKLKKGMDLGIGVEFDYAIGSITPYLGVDIGLGLTKPQLDGEDIDDATVAAAAAAGVALSNEASKTAIGISLGAIYKINDSMGADLGLTYGLGERYKTKDSKGDDKTASPITILAHFSYYF